MVGNLLKGLGFGFAGFVLWTFLTLVEFFIAIASRLLQIVRERELGE